MTDQTAKKRENKVLRRNEYYAIQDVFDGLYAKSKQGAIFTDLMSLITSLVLCQDLAQVKMRNLSSS